MLHPYDATGSDLEIAQEVHAPAPGITEVTSQEMIFSNQYQKRQPLRKYCL